VALVSTERLPVPPIRGGAIQVYIDGVVPRLAREVRVRVYTTADPELPAVETVGGVTYRRLERHGYLEAVARDLAGQTVDLVHVFNRPRSVLTLAEVAPRAAFGLNLHNAMFHPDKISDPDGSRVVRRVSFIATVSRYIADTVAQRFPEARPKLRPVYSGADPGRIRPRWHPGMEEVRRRARADYGLGEGPVVMFIGRLSEKKGVHLLLQAMQQVVCEEPRAQLLVAGSKNFASYRIDDYVAECYRLAAAIDAQVHLTQWVPPGQVPRLYAAADLVVCPSIWEEPLARVVYEAMATGLPVVVSRRGGLPEVVEDGGTGLVVDDPHDTMALATAILTLVRDADRREAMGRRARHLLETRYTWDRVARELLELYRAAVSGPPGGG